MDSTYVYLNYFQQEFRLCHGRRNYLVLPRRSGKTHGCLSVYMHQAQKSLPLGTGLFVGNTRKQILGRTLPAVFASFKQSWGLREGENYVVGKPPAKLNYPEPIYTPANGGGWENTFSFANGFYWRMTSLAVIGSSNGVTADVAAGDEAKFYSVERLLSEVIPCLSGVNDPYHSEEHSMRNPYYRGECFVSDASLSAKGNWLEKKSEVLDQIIEEGPYKGMTNRELKQQLLKYARRVIDINDKIYNAKKTGHRVMVKDPQTIALAHEMRDMMRQRAGKFHVLPNGDNTEANCKTLVRLGVLTEADAELLYNCEYLMSKEDYAWMRVVMNSPKFRREINDMRCYLTGYWQSSTISNINLLGAAYIKQMKASLSPLVYAISILGIKVKRSTEGFYYALDIEGKHGYVDNDDNGIIDQNRRVKEVSRNYNGGILKAETETFDFDHLATVNDCTMDGDVHPDDELFIAGDWNSRINWLVVGVVRLNPDTMEQTLYVVNSFYVKGDQKLDSLCKMFNSYYAPHRRQNPRITFFYDATAKHKGYALENQEDFKDVVIRYLTADHWDLVSIDMGRPMAHSAKYNDINNGLASLGYPAVRINKEKNEDLIVSLENADVRQGITGWEKDKSGEKLPYNPDLDEDAGSSVSGASSASAGSGKKSNVREEWRTDGSDAFDNLYIGVKHFRYGGGQVFACF